MERFTNTDGSGPHSARAVFRWAVLDRLAGRRRRPADGPPAPLAQPDLALISRAPGIGERPRITWLGHASWLVQLDGVSLLIDPVFSEKIAGTIRRKLPPPLRPAQLPCIDATLVSHTHYDHLDMPSLRSRVVGGRGLGRDVRRLPVRELGWWESEPIRGEVRVTFVPSQHWSRRGLLDTNRTLWGGFVVEGPSGSIYHSGDTAWFDGFAEIGRRFARLAAALLPIGAYDPPWFMEKQHLNPEQAVRAFVDLGARRFVAMHWGTFRLTDEPLDEPPQRLRAEWTRRGLPPDALQVPAVGETLQL